MLTSAAVKAARPKDRAYKLADDRGLFLYVAPTGLRSWRMKFRYQGREQLLTFGKYPEISLTDARARRDDARVQLGRGENPAGTRQRALEVASSADALTFMSTARAWHAARRSRWSAVHAGDVLASLERHVFPAIGALALGDIDAPAVLELLQAVEHAGSIETARRVRQRISAIFAFAIARKMTTENPAAIVADELQPRPAARHQPALQDLAPARELLAAVMALAAAAIVKLASELLALTAVRLAAVRGATWAEFEGIDWDVAGDAPAALWRIPAARMKLTRTKKADSALEHLVPLSRAAVDVLHQARAIAGGAPGPAELVFRGRGGQIGKGAIGELYIRAGFAGRHVPHGWRATFSTIMNELYPDESAAIDRALAHSPKDKVEAAYNRSEQLARRRSLFDRWAALLSRVPDSGAG